MQARKRMPGPPASPGSLTAEEREKLELLAKRPKSAQRDALRARIVLAAAEGEPNLQIAKRLGVSRSTVMKWRERSQTTIHRLYRAFALQPHRSETFKLSPDPMFVEKVRDIVGLYMNAPENAIMLCVHEKSQIQALNRTQPILPLRLGVPERQSHDYERNGTTTLFAALNAHTGKVVSKCFRRHRAKEYLSFLREIEKSVPSDGRQIHRIVDNYATHKTPAVQRWFAKHPRFVAHFTPTYASWLNLVERLFAEITDKALRRGSFNRVRALERAITEYLDVRDDRPFVWRALADDILRRVSNFCQSTSNRITSDEVVTLANIMQEPSRHFRYTDVFELASILSRRLYHGGAYSHATRTVSECLSSGASCSIRIGSRPATSVDPAGVSTGALTAMSAGTKIGGIEAGC